MSDDLFSALLRFHREVAMPEVRQAIENVRTDVNNLRNEMLTHFDAIYRRFERLESEYEDSARRSLASKKRSGPAAQICRCDSRSWS